MNKNDRNMKRQQRFIKVVSRRMAKAGFECQMKDNHFVVIKDEIPSRWRCGMFLDGEREGCIST